MHLSKVANRLEKAEQEVNRQEGGDVPFCCRLHDGGVLKLSRNGLQS